MEKRWKKVIVAITTITIIIGSFFIIMLIDNNPFDHGFSSEGRYDQNHLNYMGVIFENKIHVFDLTFHCETHPLHPCEDGLQYYAGDFFFNNMTPVIACAPGRVERIDWLAAEEDLPFNTSLYIINVGVRFNESVSITYCFEPFTNKTSDWELQGQLLNVTIGDWVKKGDLIGVFLKINQYAHIHWDISIPCMDIGYPSPEYFYDMEGYNQMLDLISYLNATHNDGIDRGGCYF
ncbi:MAG: hypothetical protein JW776_12230 [Candidatus Lokiarchaeota archaeon]|nr:hypothetical protein [Candidatus Lokiarchaeota archaeon]